MRLGERRIRLNLGVRFEGSEVVLQTRHKCHVTHRVLGRHGTEKVLEHPTVDVAVRSLGGLTRPCRVKTCVGLVPSIADLMESASSRSPANVPIRASTSSGFRQSPKTSQLSASNRVATLPPLIPVTPTTNARPLMRRRSADAWQPRRRSQRRIQRGDHVRPRSPVPARRSHSLEGGALRTGT